MPTPFDHPSRDPFAPDITAMLQAWRRDDAAASEDLLRAIYDELHRQAARAMRREEQAHTLQATALVNEVYLRLIDQRHVEWRNRAHFFGIAARLMRRILVDHARARRADKRGGGERALSLAEANVAAAERTDDDLDILALNDALLELTALDADQARLVELRYFSGLTIEETAEVMGVSPATVKREWATARAWLRRELRGESDTRAK